MVELSHHKNFLERGLPYEELLLLSEVFEELLYSTFQLLGLTFNNETKPLSQGRGFVCVTKVFACHITSPDYASIESTP